MAALTSRGRLLLVIVPIAGMLGSAAVCLRLMSTSHQPAFGGRAGRIAASLRRSLPGWEVRCLKVAHPIPGGFADPDADWLFREDVGPYRGALWRVWACRMSPTEQYRAYIELWEPVTAKDRGPYLHYFEDPGRPVYVQGDGPPEVAAWLRQTVERAVAALRAATAENPAEAGRDTPLLGK